MRILNKPEPPIRIEQGREQHRRPPSENRTTITIKIQQEGRDHNNQSQHRTTTTNHDTVPRTQNHPAACSRDPNPGPRTLLSLSHSTFSLSQTEAASLNSGSGERSAGGGPAGDSFCFHLACLWTERAGPSHINQSLFGVVSGDLVIAS